MKRIPLKEKYPALYKGLNQMPTGNLKRSLAFMNEHPESVIYDGAIADRRGENNSYRY